MPWGLKKKSLIKHTSSYTEVRIDHTNRQLLTHKAPPNMVNQVCLRHVCDKNSTCVDVDIGYLKFDTIVYNYDTNIHKKSGDNYTF